MDLKYLTNKEYKCRIICWVHYKRQIYRLNVTFLMDPNVFNEYWKSKEVTSLSNKNNIKVSFVSCPATVVLITRLGLINMYLLYIKFHFLSYPNLKLTLHSRQSWIYIVNFIFLTDPNVFNKNQNTKKLRSLSN